MFTILLGEIMKDELRYPLVTGAGGFIGRSLIKYLIENELSEKVIAVDVPDCPGLTSFRENTRVQIIESDLSFEKIRPQLFHEPSSIFMLAAMNGTGRFYTNPWDVLINSTLPTLHTINEFKDCCPIVYTSSSEVYASTVETNLKLIPTDESVKPSIGDIHNTRWSYATAKLLGEVALNSASKQFGTRGVVIRYHNVYGPNMGIDHFVPDFIRKIKLNNFELIGAHESRAFLYIDDAISGTIAALSKCTNEIPIYHLGSEEEFEIREAAKIILEEFGMNNHALINLPSRPGSVIRRKADITKAKNELIWQPKVNFRHGIRKIIEEENLLQ
jgi:nucleoside-diphosphate-sugar epimerase